MAENISLSNITTFTNDTTAVNTVNTNNTIIANAFIDVLSRSGNNPNQMFSNLDMNSNQIINLPPPATANSPARLVDVLPGAGNITVPPTGTSGAVVGFLNGNNTYSGLSTFTNQIALNFPTNAITTGFLTTQSLGSGTYTASAGIDMCANQINVNSDNVNVTNGLTEGVALEVNYNFGGSNLRGARIAVQGTATLTSNSNVANASQFYVGGKFQGLTQVNDNNKAGVFGVNAVAAASPSLGAIGSATGVEIDLFLQSGTTSPLKFGCTAISITGDTSQGTTYDAAFAALSQTTVGWKNGFLIAKQAGQAGVGPNGTLFATQDNFTVTNGLDISSVTFTGNAIKTPGFTVGPTGLLTISTTVQPQIVLNTTSQFSGLAFNNTGVNEAIFTWDHTNLLMEFITIPTASFTFISNLVTALTIGPTGLMTLGSAATTPNGAVATTLGSVGPTGSHTTVQEWFTVKNSAGVTRWIPAF